MSPKQFVEWTALVFREQGCGVKVTEGLEDRGADLVLIKDGKTIVVQVKHWKKNVGMSAVREVVASMPIYKADSASVACSTHFTKRAVELARVNRVQLYNLDRLLTMAPDPPTSKDVK